MIMGILNVTPDSFSDGGHFQNPDIAFKHALKMIEDGADIIDVGGESTRPGSIPVSADEEISRVIPVIQRLSKRTSKLISIDTQKAQVARAALDAGATVINDVSAGNHDSNMFQLVAETQVGYVMMHMQGVPETMQAAPSYQNVLTDVAAYLGQQLRKAVEMGVHLSQIVLDPGIGFGKTLDNNLDILSNLGVLHALGRPLLVGASRKSFIGMIDGSKPAERLGGSLAAVVAGLLQNAIMFRVHDVAETKQLIDIFTAIQKHSV